VIEFLEGCRLRQRVKARKVTSNDLACIRSLSLPAKTPLTARALRPRGHPSEHLAAQVIEDSIGRAGAADMGGAGRILKIGENYRNDVVDQQDRALPAPRSIGRSRAPNDNRFAALAPIRLAGFPQHSR
jgi:hypothetical protein